MRETFSTQQQMQLESMVVEQLNYSILTHAKVTANECHRKETQVLQGTVMNIKKFAAHLILDYT